MENYSNQTENGAHKNSMGTVNRLRVWWDSLSGRQVQILNVALIMLVGTAVYSNTLHVPFILDDSQTLFYLSGKSLAATIVHGGFRRVADASFLLNLTIHGSTVTGYHLFNLAIHLAASITLFFVMRSVCVALRTSYTSKDGVAKETVILERFIPLASALLFVLHPLQTQAVTYIIQRYTSLATLFYLLSVLAFINGRTLCEKQEKVGHVWLWLGLSLVTGLLAFGCKQITFTLPVMLVVLEMFLFRGRLINRRFFLVCGTLCAFVMAAMLIMWWGRSLDDFLSAVQMATAETDLITRKTYFLTQTRVVATYLRLLLVPVGQSLIWDSPLYESFLSVPVIAAIVLHGVILLSAVAFFRKSHQNLQAGEWHLGVLQRIVSLGIVWFYVTMVIESSIIPIHAVMFEHRIYLPSVGFFMAIAACALLMTRFYAARIKTVRMLLVVLCLVLGGLTLARNQIWNDPLSLSEESHRKFPDNHLAKIYLCYEYMSRNMHEKALPLIVSVIVENSSLVPYAKVYLGKILQGLKIDSSRFSTGEEYVRPGGFKEMIDMDEAIWRRWEALVCNNLALAYEIMGDSPNAMKMYDGALEMNPAYDLAWYNKGLLSLRLGNARGADNARIQLERINPGLANKLKSLMAS